MAPQTDFQLLQSFIASSSQEAFTELVRRHVHLVHAAALRQTRDPHLADDVTQAVFMILARRAAHVAGRTSLSGWLIKTTRYACLSASKMNDRRRFHEQKAAAMTPTTADPSTPCDEDDNEASNVLDDALSRLSPIDRSAIALRYLQNKRVHDIGQELGISEQAAQKRITRALSKLRAYFSRHGITSTADAFESSLAAQSLHAAPAALVALLTTSPTITASSTSTASLIAQSTLHSMAILQTKLLVATSAAAILLATAAVVTTRPSSPAQAASPATAPPAHSTTQPLSRFPNITMGFLESATAAGQPDSYVATTDPSTLRPAGSGSPAAYLSSTILNPTGFGCQHFKTLAAPYHGKRVRVTGWLKTEGVTRWTGLDVNVLGSDGRVFAHDNMASRAINGSTDWKQYASVVDVPTGAAALVFGTNLYGPGKVWSDGFDIEVVSSDTPLTDDTQWHTFSWRAKDYAARTDENVKRNGRPTTRFSCLVSNVASNDWGSYDHQLGDIEKYRGKKIRMTVWLKSQNVTSNSGPHIRIFGPMWRKLSDEGQRGHRPITGTRDWKQYEAIADVPADAQSIYPGITMNQKGTLWIDDVRIEVVEP